MERVVFLWKQINETWKEFYFCGNRARKMEGVSFLWKQSNETWRDFYFCGSRAMKHRRSYIFVKTEQ